jgi:uncharacterized protein YbcI
MDADSTPLGPSRHDRTGMELSEISNAMARLYAEQFDRGPTEAVAEYAGRDCIVSTVENTLTGAERSMVAKGEHQPLRDLRLLYRHASEQEFIEAVEGITGRTVRGFVSGMDTHQDIATEVFYLEPDG